MDQQEMKHRTKQFAIDIGYLVISLDKNEINQPFKNQVIRSSSSVAANYRAARRAKSKADFINKLKIVEEELDESLLFLELLAEFNLNKSKEIATVYIEGEVLLKIIVASITTSRR
ncbi:MAG TPA: four helix bundle protein [Flavitalea sp.]|nr:four helix bundle protein [Flavitalea sp.]